MQTHPLPHKPTRARYGVRSSCMCPRGAAGYASWKHCVLSCGSLSTYTEQQQPGWVRYITKGQKVNTHVCRVRCLHAAILTYMNIIRWHLYQSVAIDLVVTSYPYGMSCDILCNCYALTPLLLARWGFICLSTLSVYYDALIMYQKPFLSSVPTQKMSCISL